MTGIEPLYLIGFGIALVALEAFVTSFVIIWFGVASILVGALGFIIPSLEAKYQIGLIALIGMALLLILRTRVYSKFTASSGGDVKDNFFDEEGYGYIKGGLVHYKSVYWQIDSNETFEEDEKVLVKSASSGIAKVEKI